MHDFYSRTPARSHVGLRGAMSHQKCFFPQMKIETSTPEGEIFMSPITTIVPPPRPNHNTPPLKCKAGYGPDQNAWVLESPGKTK